MIGIYLSRFATKGSGTFPSDLVQFYRTTVARHPEFELVLVSGDPSLYSMENLMRRLELPWPAVAFDQVSQVPTLASLQDPSGLTRLVVCDNCGRLLADYRISPGNSSLPEFLPDLAKIIADPTHPSTIAPPPMRPSAPPAR